MRTEIVPTRLTAHFTTTIDPLTGLPEVVLCFGVAERGEDGIYRGKGTANLAIRSASKYKIIDPLTRVETGEKIDGASVHAVLYSLFLRALENE